MRRRKHNRNRFSGLVALTGSTSTTSGVSHSYPLGASGVQLGGIALYLYGLKKMYPYVYKKKLDRARRDPEYKERFIEQLSDGLYKGMLNSNKPISYSRARDIIEKETGLKSTSQSGWKEELMKQRQAEYEYRGMDRESAKEMASKESSP